MGASLEDKAVPIGHTTSCPSPDPLSEAIRSQSEADYKQYGISQDDLDNAYDEACSFQTIEDVYAILAQYLIDHGDDMLIPQTFTDSVRDLMTRLSNTADVDKMEQATEVEARMVAAVFHGNSVYREIRACFRNTDDVDMPCGTVRAWVIGLLWAAGLAGLNQFFSPRNPTVSVSVYIAQLFAYPMGRFCAAVLPGRVFLSGTRLAFTLNPGPFTLKEHMLITIMSNVSTSSVSYVTPVFFQQYLPGFYDQAWAGTFAYQLCVTLSVQVFGFGLAGIVRRFLVYPPQMIYFFTLSQAALNGALHNDNNNSYVDGWRISRFKFFFVVSTAMFCYFWLPNTLFPTLTFFNWTTWIAPRNALVSILTGSYYSNLGLNPLVNSLDWNWFTAVLDPVIFPFFIIAQIVAACLCWAVFAIIPVFFTNTWYTAYLPINSWYSYDNTGSRYRFAQVMLPDGSMNQTAYEEYSSPFIPATLVLRYAIMLATIPAVMTFTFLWYGSTMSKTFKNAWRRLAAHAGFDDVHSRLMSRYPEVPEVWYVAVGVVGAAFGFAAIYAWPTGTPGWIIPVAFILSAIFVIPIGVVMAVSAYETTLEIILDIIGGYAASNRPVSFLLFRAVGLGILQQAMTFVTDMKLGHYTKIPPRQMFLAQVVSTVVSSFVVVAVVQFQLGVEGMCDPAVDDHWVCGSAQTGFMGSIMWGLLGPERLFTHVDGRYWKIMFGILGGLLWPVPWYLARKKWPNSFFRYVHPVILLMGGILWAPMNLSMFWQAVPFAWFFGVYVKDRYPGWWAKYALVFSTAMTSGIAVSALVQFFAITNTGVTVPNWWGSTQYASTCDFQDCRYMTLAEGETFGPSEWH